MRSQLLLAVAQSAALATIASAADFSFSGPIESPLPKGQTPLVVRLVDLDGDAKLDAIVTGRNWNGDEGASARVAIMKGNGDGTFAAWREVFVLEGHAEDVRAVDMDGDAILDLVVSVFGRSSRVAHFRGLGDGLYAPPSYVPVERAPRGMTTVDFDGDGDRDVVCTNYSSGSLSLLRNDRSALVPLEPIRIMRHLGGLPFPQQANDSDLDGDGRRDAIITTLGASRVTVLRDAEGPALPTAVDWKPAQIGNESPAVIGSSIADFDNDGDDDIALPVLLVTQNQKVVTLRNDGAGGFAEQAVHEPLGFYYSWCSTPIDVDGDGRQDLAIGTALTGAVYFLRNETATPTSPITFTSPFLFFPYGFFVRDLTSGDVDGDGDADVVGVEIAGSTIFTLLNTTGNGIAGKPDAARRAPAEPRRLPSPAKADANEDGELDGRDLAIWLEAWVPGRSVRDAAQGGAR
jgi:hypothetical protein